MGPVTSTLFGTVYLNLSDYEDTGSGVAKVDYYASKDQGENYTHIGTATVGYSSLPNLAWDTNTFAENVKLENVWLRAIVEDKAGLRSAVDAKSVVDVSAYPFHIDNTPTVSPTNILVTPAQGSVALSWESAYNYYYIYRAETLEDLASQTEALAYTYSEYYTDYFIDPSDTTKTFYYAVTAKDTARGYKESAKSVSTGVSPLLDTTLPTISIYGSYVAPNMNFSWSAQDNVALKDVKVTITGNSVTKQYTVLSGGYQSDYENITPELLASLELTEGEYSITTEVTDNTGNKASATSSFIYDITPPEIPTGLVASSLSGRIRLGWVTSTAEDLDYYQIYRSTTETGTYNYLTYTSETKYDDRLPANVGSAYYYKIIARDKAGNQSNYTPFAFANVGDFNPSLRIAVQPVPGQSMTLYYKDFPPTYYDSSAGKYVYNQIQFYMDQETEPFRTVGNYDYDMDLEKNTSYTLPITMTGTHTIRAISKGATTDLDRVALIRFTVSEYTPTFTLGVDNVAPGGTVSFSLADFAINQYVYLYLRPTDSSNSYLTYVYYYDQASANGSFTLPASTAPGQYTLLAYQYNPNNPADTNYSGLIAFDTLNVTSTQASISLDANYPAVFGKAINILTSGFLAGEEVKFYINDLPVETRSSYYGSPSCYITLPNTLTGNKLVIVAVGQTSQRSATYSGTIQRNKPTLTLPETVTLGNAFTVSSTGYNAYETVNLLVDGSQYAANYANYNGEVTFSITFPTSSVAGRHAVDLVDASGNKVGGSVVTNRPLLTLT